MLAAHGSVSGLFAGRYAIERQLGEGATATVHLARDTQRGIAVALKILRPELAESGAAKRFLKEIDRTGQLDHPRILKVLEAGEHEGRPYFALPYMEGGTLRTRLRRESQLPLEDVIGIARSIAEALDYAHGRGLVHRDVKPENILFTGGVACLGDFGIARALETVYGEASSSAHVIRGTPAYMSPEQAGGEPNIDGRSDQYALACVVYEMITGMPAFMGPTPESIIAQRFSHGPRSVRVYRPTAPQDLEAVLARALAVVPSARFSDTTEFVAALEASYRATATTSDGAVATRRPPLLWAGAASVAAALVVAWMSWATPTEPVDPADTTRIVILPIERTVGNPPPWRDEDLLQQAITRWSDVDVVDHFQVADALRRHGPVASQRDASVVTASVGAGRYIRGRLSALGDGWLISASLYDVASPGALHTASENIPPQINEAARAYQRLAEALLLRGASAGDPPPGAVTTQSLNALRTFSDGQRALEGWDLIAADSAFRRALDADDSFGRASFWLAQVRAWQDQGSNTWLPFANRALALDGLGERERVLAQALAHLGKGEFADACSIYERLTDRSRRDFAGWLGLGQCEMLNKLVLADPGSPSGYRFQANTQRGMRAYLTAFEILPSVYGRYREDSFQRLRRLLFLSNQSVIGRGPGDSGSFQARPGLVRDSLVLVPYESETFVREGPTPPGFAEALVRQRGEFRRVAALWSVAFPHNAGVKEAVSLSLELLGDHAAIDTLRVARSLATDPEQRDRLAATEAILLLKFGLFDRPEFVRAAALLADTLLKDGEWSPQRARHLAPIAVMTGRCARARQLLERAGLELPSPFFSSGLYVQAQVALVEGVLGCDGAPSEPQSVVRELAVRIDAEARARGLPDTRANDGRFLLRPAILITPFDSVALRRVVESTGHPVAAAALHSARGAAAAASATLDTSEAWWTRAMATPDFALSTAVTRLALGDTTGAVRALDRMFDALPNYESDVFKDVGRMAAVVAGLSLRAELAARTRDSTAARRWSQPLIALWASSDSLLRARAITAASFAGAR